MTNVSGFFTIFMLAYGPLCATIIINYTKIVARGGVNMNKYLRVLNYAASILMLAAFSFFVPAAYAAQERPLKAFFLTDFPKDYTGLEKLFMTLKDSGADSVIIGPARPQALPDLDLLPNMVYIAHQIGFKIFIVMPLRDIPGLLDEHPDWTDMRYDLASGTIQPAAVLNLFNPDVMNYLVAGFKEAASYSVDGIFFSTDFYYGETDGMSRAALDEYKQRYNSALVMGRAISRVGKAESGEVVLEYGDDFREWAEMKRERLADAVKQISAACRGVNSGLILGIPLYAEGLSSPMDNLMKFSYDLNSFRNAGADMFWLAVSHRDMRASLGLNHKETMEMLARTARAAANAVRDEARPVVILQTSFGGKVLPFSEIEEADFLVKKAGHVNTAYMVSPETLLPSVLTKKLFRTGTRPD